MKFPIKNNKMKNFRFDFHKISYDSYTLEAETLEEAMKGAMTYLHHLQNDFYHGGDWVMESEVVESSIDS